jgi:hypothetical protein
MFVKCIVKVRRKSERQRRVRNRNAQIADHRDRLPAWPPELPRLIAMSGSVIRMSAWLPFVSATGAVPAPSLAFNEGRKK